MTKGKNTKKRAPLRKKSKKTTVPLSIKKYVKSTISRNIENKCSQVNFSLDFGNYNNSLDMEPYPMLPYSGGYWTISQGVLQGNRIGNQLKVKKLYLNYVITANAYNAVTNPNPVPQEVMMMLGYVKSSPSFLPTNLNTDRLFQSGSSVTAPNGTLRDLVAVVNKDLWCIKKRWTHKIGFADYSGTGINAASQSFANNDFKLNVVKRLDITKYVQKIVKFDDAATGATTTPNLFLMMESVQSNGFAGAATNLPVKMEFWIDFSYEDA